MVFYSQYSPGVLPTFVETRTPSMFLMDILLSHLSFDCQASESMFSCHSASKLRNTPDCLPRPPPKSNVLPEVTAVLLYDCELGLLLLRDKHF